MDASRKSGPVAGVLKFAIEYARSSTRRRLKGTRRHYSSLVSSEYSISSSESRPRYVAVNTVIGLGPLASNFVLGVHAMALCVHSRGLPLNH